MASPRVAAGGCHKGSHTSEHEASSCDHAEHSDSKGDVEDDSDDGDDDKKKDDKKKGAIKVWGRPGWGYEAVR